MVTHSNKRPKQQGDASKRGFASMSKEKVLEIAHKGGEARKLQLGPGGYAEMGHKGGETRAQQLGHAGYSELGKKGGKKRAQQLGPQGYSELGKKGGRKGKTAPKEAAVDETE